MAAQPEQGWDESEIVSVELAMPPLVPKILIVDDDPGILKLLCTLIQRHGVSCDTAASLQAADTLMRKTAYDILFLDLTLPDGSGISLLKERLDGCAHPVAVIITGEQGLEAAIQAVRKGAYDFISKPFSLSLFEERLEKIVGEWRSRIRFHYYQAHLEGLVSAMLERLLRTNQERERVFDMTVAALGAALDLRDPETEEHCRRVSENSVRLGRALGLSESELRDLRWSSYLHDIGKIGVPEHIITKPAALTPEEMESIKGHPLLGYRMISNIEFLEGATDVVLYHHEKYDGSGYPHGLKGEEIPLAARIFAAIDAMDAMVYDRPYRKALTFSAFVEELKRGSGSHFDPAVVAKVVELPPSTWQVEVRSGDKNNRASSLTRDKARLQSRRAVS